MNRRAAIKLRAVLVWFAAIIAIVATAVNYYWAHKTLDDYNLQWFIYMASSAFVTMLLFVYVAVAEYYMGRRLNAFFSFCLSIYLLVSFLGVLAGYNLHTDGFVLLLNIIAAVSVALILFVLCRNYYSQKR